MRHSATQRIAKRLAQKVAQRFEVRCVPFASLYDTLSDVVILTDPSIPVGHKKSEMNPSYLRPNMAVLDVTQLPGDSPFGAEARQRGCTVVEPADVYLDQLSGQFKAIAGEDLPSEASAGVIGAV